MSKNYTSLLFTMLAAGFCNLLTAQTINTVAGTGTAGYNGNGSPAVTKDLNDPWGVAVDGAQNLYIADQANHLIRKVTPAGVISNIGGIPGNTMFMGDEVPATNATFNTPYGLHVDAAGNVYVADQFNNRIRKIDPAGIVHTVAGFSLIGGYSGDGGPATAADLLNPTGVTIDAAGNLYIADYGNHRVRMVNTAGIITTIAGDGIGGSGGDGGPATNAQLRNPYDVAVDAAGNIFIADWYWRLIRKINTSGIISTFITTPERVNSVDLDRAGNVYFTCMDHTLYKTDPTGAVIDTLAGSGSTTIAGASGDGGPAKAALLYDAGAVAIGPTGNVYVGDRTNNKIRRISYPVIPVMPITGATTLCQGATSALSNATSGGTWSSSNPAIATVGLTTGVVSGMAGGNAIITYATVSNITTTTVTIISPSSIGGAGKILGLNYTCPGRTVILTQSVAGGVWSSSNTGIATISTTGIVRGVAPGKSNIIYTINGVCGSTASINYPFTTLNWEDCIAEVTTTPATGIVASIKAWPNPNEGTFTINMVSAIDEAVTITITNVVGQKVKEYTTATNKPMEVTLNSTSGLYFVNGVSEHGKWSQKVLVNAFR